MPLKVSSLPMGSWIGHGVALQAVVDHVQHVIEIGAHDVHLVDVDHAGDLVVVGLTPHSLRLGLNAALGAHNGHRAVQHAQGTLHLHGEVHVARGVDDVDAGLGTGLAVRPEAGGGGGSDGDATLLLLRHPVHGGGAVVGLTDLVVDAGVEQDTLGGGGLAGIDVGHDADVSGILQRNFSRHSFSFLRLPAVVGESLVGLSHLVGILALLHGAADVVGGVHDLAGQALLHGASRCGRGNRWSASADPGSDGARDEPP